MKFISFNKLSHKEIWFNSLVATGIGFFATLIVGTIFGMIGSYSKDNVFISIKIFLAFISPFAVGIAIGIKQKMTILEIIAIGIVAFIVSNSSVKPQYLVESNSIKYTVDSINLNINTKIIGDVISAWIGAVISVYLFSIIKIDNSFSIVIIPIIGILLGMLNALWLTYISNLFLVWISKILYLSINTSKTWRIILSPFIATIMGIALTLPISSASIAYSIQLDSYSASIALAGTSAQMIAFGFIVLLNTKNVSSSISTGLGTTMIQMNNYMKNWKILIIPCVASAICGFIASFMPLEFNLFASGNFIIGGMGTSILYGPLFTMLEFGWNNYIAWIHVILLQILLPIIIAFAFYPLMIKLEWIKPKELTLWKNI